MHFQVDNVQGIDVSGNRTSVRVDRLVVVQRHRVLHPVGQIDNAGEFLERGGSVEDAPQAIVGQRHEPELGGHLPASRTVQRRATSSSSSLFMRRISMMARRPCSPGNRNARSRRAGKVPGEALPQGCSRRVS